VIMSTAIVFDKYMRGTSFQRKALKWLVAWMGSSVAASETYQKFALQNYHIDTLATWTASLICYRKIRCLLSQKARK
jgi:hypothetical protein